jgi:neutral amino acid transport system permease protein
MDWGLIGSNALEAAIGADMVIYCLAAIGLNVHFGYAGLLNFGQAAFVAVAAYGLATMVATFGLSFWLGISVGLVAVIVLAVLLGVPTLRLRADYLAIVTLAAAEIVRLTFRSVTLRDTFGGSACRASPAASSPSAPTAAGSTWGPSRSAPGRAGASRSAGHSSSWPACSCGR